MQVADATSSSVLPHFAKGRGLKLVLYDIISIKLIAIRQAICTSMQKAVGRKRLSAKLLRARDKIII